MAYNMNNGIAAYCSQCLSKTVHQPVVDKSGTFRKRHQCTKCRALTVHCCCWVRGCSHMAIFLSKKKTDEPRRTAKLWCAEHGGEISSFEKLAVRLRDLVEWNEFFKRETVDMRKVTKGVFVALSITATAIPVGYFMAPALAARLGAMGVLGAASTGIQIASLTGAALESASLAYIGGGAIAAGGGGMALGMGIIVATGAGLGGKIGGSVANAYFGEVKDYKINKLREGKKGNVVFVNGFLQQDDDKFDDWLRGTSRHFPNSSAYGVTWESGRLLRLGEFLSGKKVALASIGIGMSLNKLRTKMALASKAIPGAGTSLAKAPEKTFANPWHVALYKAGAVGALNADMLARHDGQAVTLMGHSLGARTIYTTLQNLAEKPETRAIKDVFLFGGAVGRNNPEEWEKAASAVSGRIWNFYSRNDQILRKLYRVANPWFSETIGSGPIECGALNIENINCTARVARHGDYKPQLSELLSKALG